MLLEYDYVTCSGMKFFFKIILNNAFSDNCILTELISKLIKI